MVESTSAYALESQRIHTFCFSLLFLALSCLSSCTACVRADKIRQAEGTPLPSRWVWRCYLFQAHWLDFQRRCICTRIYTLPSPCLEHWPSHHSHNQYPKRSTGSHPSPTRHCYTSTCIEHAWRGRGTRPWWGSIQANACQSYKSFATCAAHEHCMQWPHGRAC